MKFTLPFTTFPSFLVEEQWRGCCAFPRELASSDPEGSVHKFYFFNFFLAAGDRCDINLKKQRSY